MHNLAHRRSLQSLQIGVLVTAFLAFAAVTAMLMMGRGGSGDTSARSPLSPLASPLIRKSVDRMAAQNFAPFVYTIVISSATGDSPAFVTDTLPVPVVPNAGTFKFSAGTGTIVMGPPAEIRWNGNLAPGQVVTLSVQVTATVPQPQIVTNTAILASPNGTFTSNAVITILNPKESYIPYVEHPWCYAYMLTRKGS